VIEEIKRGEDEPGDHVHDLHLQALWPSHALGLPIIGTRDSVAGFSREDLTGYMQRRYVGGHVVVAAVGLVDHSQLVDLANRAFAQVPSGSDLAKMDQPSIRTGRNLVAKDVEQVHFCIGGAGVSLYDDELYAASVLDGVLGSGMSSRLFQEVREKRGLAYSVGSYHLAYTHGGAFTVFGGTGIQTWDQVQEVVRAELDDVIANGPTDDELAKVKRQIAGNLVLGQEGMSARMMRLARNEFVHGRYVPLEETRAKLEAVTAKQVQDLAARILGPESLLTTAIGPFSA
jgi:predicted Zn-dependent peptidase